MSPSTSPGSTENDYPIETRDNLPVTGRRKNLSSEEISKLLSTARIDRVNVETISKYIKENPDQALSTAMLLKGKLPVGKKK